MENKIPQKSFDAQMHIIRDVHFDVDKYKVGELYVIKYKIPNALTINEKVVGKLIKVERDALTFDIFERCHLKSVPDIKNHYTIKTLILSIDQILRDSIEVERLLTATEAFENLMNVMSKEYTTDMIEKHKSLINAAYKINTPEEAEEIAKNSHMNIVDDIMKADEEEKKNYVVWLTSSFSGISKPFSILDSEGDFDPEAFKGLATGSGRVRVKLVKGKSTIQFIIHSNYIKVAPDVIAITGNYTKRSICMTLMRDNFREMFDKIEFEQIL